MPIRCTGQYDVTAVAGERVAAFIPAPLPPGKPPLALEGRLADRLQRAQAALSRLETAGEMLPSLAWFIYAFVRKEAVLSSQIEGTQATLVDLLAFEGSGKGLPDAEVEEICNHLDALAFARHEIAREGGLPISARLLNEAHRRLMRGARGAGKQPGELRRSQNWVGGSRPGNAAFVPPPPQALPEALGALEKYLHADDSLPKLVRIGLAHVQFETIHPYLDGNGRLGRLLISLLLEHWGLLSQPLLYLSLFFRRHREEYYRRLNAVRADGDWEGWLDFFLDGVAAMADEATAAARSLSALAGNDRMRILQSKGVTIGAVRLFERLPQQPFVTVAGACKLLGASKPTAARAVQALEQLGILAETSGRKRDRLFAYQRYVDLLRAGTEQHGLRIVGKPESLCNAPNDTGRRSTCKHS